LLNALPATDESSFDTLILGIGNVLWADEGFGVRTVEVLNADYCFPSNVRLMDGGSHGIVSVALGPSGVKPAHLRCD